MSPGRNVIEDLYRRMDDLVGKTIEKCRDKGTMVMVISDHGFGPFRTGIDLNRWLEENGYLVVDDERRGEEHLAGVDWSRTRAFAIGLAGIFINIKDKYSQGIVEPGEEADSLRSEIAGRLEALVDTSSPSKRREASLRGRQVLSRSVQGQCTGPDCRLSARLPRLVGGGHRQDDPVCLPAEYQGVERRSLR